MGWLVAHGHTTLVGTFRSLMHIPMVHLPHLNCLLRRLYFPLFNWGLLLYTICPFAFAAIIHQGNLCGLQVVPHVVIELGWRYGSFPGNTDAHEAWSMRFSLRLGRILLPGAVFVFEP